MSFFPLDRNILSSSLWATGTPESFKVWTYLLLTADIGTGIVRDADPAIAMRCGLSIEVTAEALAWLSAPDRYSRTKDHDGRRIEAIEGGGYVILNYEHYAVKDHSTPRVRAWRERRRVSVTDETRSTVTGNAPPLPETKGQETRDTDTDTDTDTGVQGGEPPRLTAPPRARSRRKPGDETPLEVEQANVVIDALSAAQMRLRPGARGYRHTAAHRTQIVRRLRDGTTVAELLEVVAAREAECRSKPEAIQWLNPTTPFRDSNWARSEAAVALAAPAPAAATSGAASTSAADMAAARAGLWWASPEAVAAVARGDA